MYAALPRCALLLALVSGAASADVALDPARQAYVEARVQRDALEQRRQALAGALEEESARIRALKARAEGSLIRPVGLDAALRRSQTLSARMSDLAKERAAAENRLEARRQELTGALTAQHDALQAKWDGADRNERRLLVEAMRALRAERDQVRGGVAMPASTPTRAAPQGGTSDDPVELLARADALRDAEDKARARLTSLDARLAELRSERDLDRRMNEFLGDEALLDEQDRRFGGASPFAARVGEPASEQAPASDGPMGPQGVANPTPAGFVSRGRVDDGRPAVGKVPPLAAEVSDGDELERLERERASVSAQADAFGREAAATEARARGAR